MAENILYYGDNLEILRRYIKDESVDLVYLDPPCNSSIIYSGASIKFIRLWRKEYAMPNNNSKPRKKDFTGTTPITCYQHLRTITPEKVLKEENYVKGKID